MQQAERDDLDLLQVKGVSQLASDHLVSFRGVSRCFGRRRARRVVLRDVNLAVEAGTATWIGGQNGAGKTTLLRIATGILAPDTGQVAIDGISSDQSWREFHRRVGFLSAGDRGLYARLSVRGHLEYWATVAFIPRHIHNQVVDEALAKFGLTELAGRRAERLSQGQRQRLRLALTVVHAPQVLLLDEPRTSLDAEGLEMLSAAIGEVLAREGAVIWCSPPGESLPIEFDQKLLLVQGKLHHA